MSRTKDYLMTLLEEYDSDGLDELPEDWGKPDTEWDDGHDCSIEARDPDDSCSHPMHQEGPEPDDLR